jgi:hypothetical protein
MKLFWTSWLPFRRWRVVGIVPSADEVPPILPRNGAVLVCDGGPPKWIVFDCPCRTGHRIMLNTDRQRYPAWRVDLVSLDRLTLSPSVDAHDDKRRCHYLVRNGRIVWV